MSEAASIADARLLLAPGTEGLVPRPQLLTQAPKTLLVIAPAGYGKSSLLAQWAATKQAAWVTLPPAAEDPTFFLALLATVAGTTPSNQLTPELLAALQARPLVLDDCQHVTSEAARKLLDTLIDAMPAEALALGSRVEPNLPALGRKRVRRLLLEVGTEQLAFRGEELGELCTALLGHQAPEAERAALERVTDGWAALLVLAAPYVESAGQTALDAFATGDTALYDYLAAEVLDTLPTEIRQETLEASLLPRLSPDNIAPELLRTLDRRRLLIRAEDGVTRVFHPLLAEFLRQRLKEERGEEAFKGLCRKVGGQLLSTGNWADAFPLLRDADDWEAIANWLEAQAERHPFRRWLRLLPEQTLHTRPLLALRRANGHLDGGEYPDAERILLFAEAEYQRQGDTDGALRVVLARARLLRLSGRLAEAAALGEELESRLDSAGVQSGFGILYHQALMAVNYYQDLGRTERYQAALIRHAEETGSRQALVNSLMHRAATLRRWAGDFEGQEADLERVQSLYESGVPDSVRASIATIRLEAAWMRRLPNIQEHLEQARELAQLAQARQVLGYIECVEALFAARSGSLEEARKALAFLVSEELPARLARAFLAARAGDEAMLEEDTHPPTEALERAQWHHFVGPLILAGKRTHAAELARSARDAALMLHMPFDEALSRAFLALSTGDATEAGLALDAFFTHGWQATLEGLERDDAVRLMGLGLPRTRYAAACRDLLSHWGVTSVHLTTFGALEVIWNGQQASWPRPKARALFAYLLLQEGRPVPVERVADMLWPEADIEKARQSYRTHCSYLRQALGADCLETTHESVRLVLPGIVDDDRSQFLRAHASDSPLLWLAALERVGDAAFLAEFPYEDWADAARETMHRARRELRLRLAEHRLSLGDPDGALPHARAALTEDPLDEDAALTVLTAESARHRPGEARRVWESYCLAAKEAELPLSADALSLARKLGIA
ncbi:MAG: hypothetical protein QM758_02310 [Armatimonas sp.]